MKKYFLFFGLLITVGVYAQSVKLSPTSEIFKNKELVYSLEVNNQRVGEFWPVKGMNLVTKETDPTVFTGNLVVLQEKLRAVATAPDGMTKASVGGYIMQGKSLSNGRPCGDGIVYDYGIIIVEKGFNITFTHKKEINNFDSLYNVLITRKATMFFLPSILRNGKYLLSLNTIEKVLVRRNTYAGEKVGVMLFDYPVTYDKAREIILGLDRAGKSETTHIYVLDGGPTWGQSSKEVNGNIVTIGTSNPTVITNAIVLY